MRRKFITGCIILAILGSLTFTSCLETEESLRYTRENELAMLHDFILGLEKKGFDVDTSALGVYYILLDEGAGPVPVEGDTVSVKYVSYLIDNTVIGSSFYQGDSVWTYVHKVERSLPAWEEIVSMMKEGSRMEFIIPSDLAYGENGTLYVPPYSSLIFVTIMDDIRQRQN
jgi:FKBP-type peptidyl-prolyl cis-trans isomerase